MNRKNEPVLPILNRAGLLKDWPTHCVPSAFWEELGRAVATFSWLENFVLRAYFGLTSSHEFDGWSDVEAAYPQWEKNLEESFTGVLSKRTSKLKAAFADDDRVPSERAAGIIDSLNKIRDRRNMLCHGVWKDFDSEGFAHLEYFAKTRDGLQSHEDRLTRESISLIRAETVDLMCEIVNTLSAAGVVFPGIVLPDVDDTA